MQYLECEADKKPSQLIDLLIKNKSKKIIVWVLYVISSGWQMHSILMVGDVIDTKLFSCIPDIFDMCLRWLLGGGSSSSHCFEGIFFDSPSWENEAGQF